MCESVESVVSSPAPRYLRRRYVVENIGNLAVKEDVVVADVRLEVGVEDSCFAQPGRMFLKEDVSEGVVP